MLQVLILVCSTHLSPADCQVETATDVISGPQTTSVMACGLHGQALLAQTTLRKRTPDEYVKIRCTHLKDTKTAQKL